LLYPNLLEQKCSCTETPSVEQELASKTAIFSGRVIQISEEDNGNNKSTADPITVIFEVKQTWKGVSKSQVVVYTARSSASCGYVTFLLHSDYLIYAYGDKDRLATGICERTKPLTSAHEDLAILGIGEKPSEQVNLITDTHLNIDEISQEDVTGKSNNPLLWILVITILIAATIYLMRRYMINK
jgi:hypothetical protein